MFPQPLPAGSEPPGQGTFAVSSSALSPPPGHSARRNLAVPRILLPNTLEARDAAIAGEFPSSAEHTPSEGQGPQHDSIASGGSSSSGSSSSGSSHGYDEFPLFAAPTGDYSGPTPAVDTFPHPPHNNNANAGHTRSGSSSSANLAVDGPPPTSAGASPHLRSASPYSSFAGARRHETHASKLPVIYNADAPGYTYMGQPLKPTTGVAAPGVIAQPGSVRNTPRVASRSVSANNSTNGNYGAAANPAVSSTSAAGTTVGMSPTLSAAAPDSIAAHRAVAEENGLGALTRMRESAINLEQNAPLQSPSQLQRDAGASYSAFSGSSNAFLRVPPHQLVPVAQSSSSSGSGAGGAGGRSASPVLLMHSVNKSSPFYVTPSGVRRPGTAHSAHNVTVDTSADASAASGSGVARAPSRGASKASVAVHNFAPNPSLASQFAVSSAAAENQTQDSSNSGRPRSSSSTSAAAHGPQLTPMAAAVTDRLTPNYAALLHRQPVESSHDNSDSQTQSYRSTVGDDVEINIKPLVREPLPRFDPVALELRALGSEVRARVNNVNTKTNSQTFSMPKTAASSMKQQGPHAEHNKTVTFAPSSISSDSTAAASTESVHDSSRPSSSSLHHHLKLLESAALAKGVRPYTGPFVPESADPPPRRFTLSVAAAGTEPPQSFSQVRILFLVISHTIYSRYGFFDLFRYKHTIFYH